MSRLEDFLGNNDDQINIEMFEKVNRSYQCVECEFYSKNSYFDPEGMIIYWYCDNGHLSKVSLVGKIGD
ncbi:MAG: hypothetical protein EBU08_18075 [Micrococcales bacterium]|jgi:hypothetical protein|nr:hypothetical protein [Micrococcales bacterium]